MKNENSSHRDLLTAPRATQPLSDFPEAPGGRNSMSNDAYFRVIAGSMGMAMLLAFALLVGLSFPDGASLTDAAASPDKAITEKIMVTEQRQ